MVEKQVWPCQDPDKAQWRHLKRICWIGRVHWHEKTAEYRLLLRRLRQQMVRKKRTKKDTNWPLAFFVRDRPFSCLTNISCLISLATRLVRFGKKVVELILLQGTNHFVWKLKKLSFLEHFSLKANKKSSSNEIHFYEKGFDSFLCTYFVKAIILRMTPATARPCIHINFLNFCCN